MNKDQKNIKKEVFMENDKGKIVVYKNKIDVSLKDGDKVSSIAKIINEEEE